MLRLFLEEFYEIVFYLQAFSEFVLMRPPFSFILDCILNADLPRHDMHEEAKCQLWTQHSILLKFRNSGDTIYNSAKSYNFRNIHSLL